MEHTGRVTINRKILFVFLLTFACCKAQTCSSDECGVPPSDDNTDYTPAKSCYNASEQIEYICAGDLGGPPINLCGSDGSWSFPMPVCEVFTCQPLPVASNVILSPNQTTYEARESVAYSCGETAELIGPSSATCDSQDTWSPSTIPLCVEVCTVPTIDNGEVTPANITFRDGDSAEVFCYDGYTIEAGGSSNIVCQSNGTWDQIPTCNDVDECDVSPCQNNGVCFNFGGGYNCTCTPQWQGDNCETDVNECDNSPCQNNASCNNSVGGYECICLSGWEGVNCETDVDECDLIPCQNNGVCNNYNGGYNCTCASGWQGDNCELDVNECDLSPCVNNGVCNNYDGGYNCTCEAGWQGNDCETDVNECFFTPCQNNGNCTNYDGGYNCTCARGWQGDNCELDVNECNLSPCLNNGVCNNNGGGYNCTCEAGWQGFNCEIDVNECDLNPCLNNGVCNNYDGGYNCSCPREWQGTNCENDVDECSFTPCQNGGVCNNFNGGYNCSCQPGWFGFNCESDSSNCLIAPINNSNTENGKNITNGKSYIIRCDSGYSYNQLTEFPVSCTYGDLVSDGVIPETCYKNCSRRNPPQNGDVTYGVLHGEVVEYSCNLGYMLEGPPSSTCNDGMWESPQPPTCNAICRPPVISNGRLTPVNATFTEGDRAQVTCDAGYKLEGNSSIVCQKNGTWGQLPACLAYCTVPPIDNSNSKQGVNISHGEIFLIQCDRGYSYNMRTIFEVSCINGDLIPMDVIPEACYQSCMVPPIENSNTDTGEDLNDGQSYIIRCDEGYSFNQQTLFRVTCKDGDLVPPYMVPQTCHQDCRPRDAPPNGDVSPGARHGKTVEYSCDQGFLLVGPPSTTCKDGRWIPEETPSCRAICPVPDVENGYVKPKNVTFIEGNRAFVTCDAGYTLEPKLPLKCQRDGTWDQIPHCLSYCMVPPIDNSNTPSGVNISHGQLYAISCDPGTSYNQKNQFGLFCSNGDLIPFDVIPESCYRDCPPRREPQNGDVTPGRRHGETVKYSCDPGYFRTGPPSSTCNDGWWEPPQMATCEITCPVPVIDNGQLTPVKDMFKEGDRANVSCDPGFSLADGRSPTVECLPDGTWSPIPICFETCDIPPVSNSNTASGLNMVHGVHHTIVCDHGFSYNKEITFDVTCVNGDLVPATVLPEKCYSDCPDRLMGPPNGDVTGGNRHGDTVYYSCYSGYLLQGPPSATCDNGQWDPVRQPSCSVICPTPKIDNARLMPNNVTFTEGDTAVVSCDEGFHLEDESSSTMVCLSNGQWNQIPRCIVSAMCIVPPVPNSNFQSGGSLEYDDTAIILCKQGFSFDQKVLFKISCNDGVLVSRTDVPDACYRDCSPRIPPDHGQVIPEYDYQHGVTVEYSCFKKYELRGPESATCNNGRWDPMHDPTCVEESRSEDDVSLHCMENVFRVLIPGELLTREYESIHLNDNNCVGTREPNGDVVIESQYDSCGTIQEVDSENNKIVYKNTVSDMMAPHSSAAHSPAHVNIEVECLFDQDKFVSTEYIVESSLRQSLSQAGEYDVSFALYSDETFSKVQETPVLVDESTKIFLKIQLETEVSGLSVLGTRCWATPTDNPEDEVVTNLIVNGCPANENDVQVVSDHDSTAKPSFAFSASVLQFEDSDLVYVHCNTRICEASLFGECRPYCNGSPRSRRSSGLTLTRRFSQGPIIKDISANSVSDGYTSSLPALVALGVFSVLTICGIAFASVLFVFRKHTMKSTADDDIY